MSIETLDVRLAYRSPVQMSNGNPTPRDYHEPAYSHLTEGEVPYALTYVVNNADHGSGVRTACELVSLSDFTEADATFGGLLEFLGARADSVRGNSGANVVGAVVMRQEGSGVLPVVFADPNERVLVTRVGQNGYVEPWRFVVDGKLDRATNQDTKRRRFAWPEQKTFVNRSGIVLPITVAPGETKSELTSGVVSAQGLIVVQHSTAIGILEYVVGPNTDALNGKIELQRV